MELTGATFEKYRFDLERDLSDVTITETSTLLFVMLNPSTADATTDDPTIRRCKGFASRHGYNRMLVGNLNPMRITHPSELRVVPYDVYTYNLNVVKRLAEQSDNVIVAWGRHGHKYSDNAMCRTLAEQFDRLNCLGTNYDGTPRHPLYVPHDAPLIEYDWEKLARG